MFVPTVNRSPLPTHAPRVGRDTITLMMSLTDLSFQFTHPVWGATTTPLPIICSTARFQFTHPVWGATASALCVLAVSMCFNSRTPCGVRQADQRARLEKYWFQFTHPVWGAT